MGFDVESRCLVHVSKKKGVGFGDNGNSVVSTSTRESATTSYLMGSLRGASAASTRAG
jgi:hypothetical protein